MHHCGGSLPSRRKTTLASGFFALLDDIAAIAKGAAASLDDTAAQAVKVGGRAAGIVIDDTAVTPRYVVGFAADRELPIIGRIAVGSLKNKLLLLLPGAVLLSWLAPWAVTPLLMIGGAYLCFEGWEKIREMVHPHAEGDSRAAQETEAEKVKQAIRTDFILSAEIMAISLAAISSPSVWTRATVLAMVALLVTFGVYGAVALIVKADDAGLWLAQRGRFAWQRSLGDGVVHAMPRVLKVLSLVGMLAMLWVGGGILLLGLADRGLGAVPHGVEDVAHDVGGVLGPVRGAGTWLFEALVAGILGIGIGWIVARVAGRWVRH